MPATTNSDALQAWLDAALEAAPTLPAGTRRRDRGAARAVGAKTTTPHRMLRWGVLLFRDCRSDVGGVDVRGAGAPAWALRTTCSRPLAPRTSPAGNSERWSVTTGASASLSTPLRWGTWVRASKVFPVFPWCSLRCSLIFAGQER